MVTHEGIRSIFWSENLTNVQDEGISFQSCGHFDALVDQPVKVLFRMRTTILVLVEILLSR